MIWINHILVHYIVNKIGAQYSPINLYTLI